MAATTSFRGATVPGGADESHQLPSHAALLSLLQHAIGDASSCSVNGATPPTAAADADDVRAAQQLSLGLAGLPPLQLFSAWSPPPQPATAEVALHAERARSSPSKDGRPASCALDSSSGWTSSGQSAPRFWAVSFECRLEVAAVVIEWKLPSTPAVLRLEVTSTADVANSAVDAVFVRQLSHKDISEITVIRVPQGVLGAGLRLVMTGAPAAGAPPDGSCCIRRLRVFQFTDSVGQGGNGCASISLLSRFFDAVDSRGWGNLLALPSSGGLLVSAPAVGVAAAAAAPASHDLDALLPAPPPASSASSFLPSLSASSSSASSSSASSSASIPTSLLPPSLSSSSQQARFGAAAEGLIRLALTSGSPDVLLLLLRVLLRRPLRTLLPPAAAAAGVALLAALRAEISAARHKIALYEYSSCALRGAKQPAYGPLPAVFDPAACSSGVSLSNSGLTASSSSGSHNFALLDVGPFSEGHASWTFKLDEDTSSQCTCFGAATKPVEVPNYEHSKSMWMVRAYNGYVYQRGTVTKSAATEADKIKKGDTVRFDVDFEEGDGIARLYINGADRGVVFSGLRGTELYPAVAFYSQSRAVSVVACEGPIFSSRGAAGAAAPTLPSASSAAAQGPASSSGTMSADAASSTTSGPSGGRASGGTGTHRRGHSGGDAAPGGEEAPGAGGRTRGSRRDSYGAAAAGRGGSAPLLRGTSTGSPTAPSPSAPLVTVFLADLPIDHSAVGVGGVGLNGEAGYRKAQATASREDRVKVGGRSIPHGITVQPPPAPHATRGVSSGGGVVEAPDSGASPALQHSPTPPGSPQGPAHLLRAARDRSGRQFSHTATLVYWLGGQHETLSGGVGLTDSATSDTRTGPTSSPVTFEVWSDCDCDGGGGGEAAQGALGPQQPRLLWRSAPITASRTPPQYFSLPVLGVIVLRLVCRVAGGNEGAYCAWMDPLLSPARPWACCGWRNAPRAFRCALCHVARGCVQEPPLPWEALRAAAEGSSGDLIAGPPGSSPDALDAWGRSPKDLATSGGLALCLATYLHLLAHESLRESALVVALGGPPLGRAAVAASSASRPAATTSAAAAAAAAAVPATATSTSDPALGATSSAPLPASRTEIAPLEPATLAAPAEVDQFPPGVCNVCFEPSGASHMGEDMLCCTHCGITAHRACANEHGGAATAGGAVPVFACDGCRAMRAVAAVAATPGIMQDVSQAPRVAAARALELSFSRGTIGGVPDATQPQCALCCRLGGIMKPTRPPFGWAHIFCALMVPGVCFANPDRLEGPDLRDVERRLFRGPRCQLCRDPGGAVLKCARPDCPRVHHPMCAARANCFFGWSDLGAGATEGYAYCDAHGPPSMCYNRVERRWVAARGGNCNPPGVGPRGLAVDVVVTGVSLDLPFLCGLGGAAAAADDPGSGSLCLPAPPPLEPLCLLIMQCASAALAPSLVAAEGSGSPGVTATEGGPDPLLPPPVALLLCAQLLPVLGACLRRALSSGVRMEALVGWGSLPLDPETGAPTSTPAAASSPLSHAASRWAARHARSLYAGRSYEEWGQRASAFLVTAAATARPAGAAPPTPAQLAALASCFASPAVDCSSASSPLIRDVLSLAVCGSRGMEPAWSQPGVASALRISPLVPCFASLLTAAESGAGSYGARVLVEACSELVDLAPPTLLSSSAGLLEAVRWGALYTRGGVLELELQWPHALEEGAEVNRESVGGGAESWGVGTWEPEATASGALPLAVDTLVALLQLHAQSHGWKSRVFGSWPSRLSLCVEVPPDPGFGAFLMGPFSRLLRLAGLPEEEFSWRWRVGLVGSAADAAINPLAPVHPRSVLLPLRVCPLPCWDRRRRLGVDAVLGAVRLYPLPEPSCGGVGLGAPVAADSGVRVATKGGDLFAAVCAGAAGFYSH